MIVQIQKAEKGKAASLYLIAQTAEERRDLALLAETMKDQPFLQKDHHVLTMEGVENLFLVTSKG